jgi:hypothetical protein
MFAFLALAAIAKFSRDGDYPLKKTKMPEAVRRTTHGSFGMKSAFEGDVRSDLFTEGL